VNYLWQLRPYFRQTAGELDLGSLAGIVMNTAVVLPAILLGAAIDKALALERGEATPGDVALAALLLIGGTLLTEGPRVLKRWWLMTANARMRANLRADALRGTLSRPLADLHKSSIGDQMARIVGDVEVLGVGVREFTIETWDTVPFPCRSSWRCSRRPAHAPRARAVPRHADRPASGLGAKTVAPGGHAALTASVQELLAGFRVLRFFGRAPAATAEVEGFSRRFAERNLSATRLRLGLPPLYSTLMMSGILFVIWQGGERVIAGAMSVGVFVAYLALYIRFVERGFRIPQMVNSIQSGGAAYARLEPMLAPALTMTGEPLSSFKPDRAGSGRQEEI
jgi:ABC-type multidrug transport system fused ATPase/permease subunit